MDMLTFYRNLSHVSDDKADVWWDNKMYIYSTLKHPHLPKEQTVKKYTRQWTYNVHQSTGCKGFFDLLVGDPRVGVVVVHVQVPHPMFHIRNNVTQCNVYLKVYKKCNKLMKHDRFSSFFQPKGSILLGVWIQHVSAKKGIDNVSISRRATLPLRKSFLPIMQIVTECRRLLIYTLFTTRKLLYSCVLRLMTHGMCVTNCTHAGLHASSMQLT